MAEYIEREAAIAALTEFRDDQTVSKYVSVENCMVARGAIERATKVLESLPAPDVEPVQEWIPVKDRLPESGKEGVLIALLWGGVDIGWCEDGRWCSEFVNEYEDGEVTHWMPLPKPPKGE